MSERLGTYIFYFGSTAGGASQVVLCVVGFPPVWKPCQAYIRRVRKYVHDLPIIVYMYTLNRSLCFFAIFPEPLSFLLFCFFAFLLRWPSSAAPGQRAPRRLARPGKARDALPPRLDGEPSPFPQERKVRDAGRSPGSDADGESWRSPFLVSFAVRVVRTAVCRGNFFGALFPFCSSN